MMTTKFLGALLLVATTPLAFADSVVVTAGQSITVGGGQSATLTTAAPGSAPASDDVSVETGRLKTMYPNTHFNSIQSTPVAGIYEVVMGKNIAYTDADGRYFIFGHLFDMHEQVDLTAQREEEVKESQRVEFPSKYLQNAIKTVHGDGTRQLVVFADPNCPYCKKLESELGHINNVTIYTFLYPVLGEDSKSLSIATWCAHDPSATWVNWMVGHKRPALVSCTSPLNDNLELGTRLGVNGTPAIITADGRLIPGAASADQIEKWMGGKQ
jgi:thiol:disulfide interchange protein DsbC